MDYTSGPSEITRVLERRAGEGFRVIQCEKDSFLSLKMKTGPMSQGLQGAPRNWKRQTSYKAIQNSREDTLILTQGDPCESSDLENCKITFFLY